MHVLGFVSCAVVSDSGAFCRGNYPPPPRESDILGLEMSGVVVSCGPDCVLDTKPGARVMALLGSGGYSEYVCVNERLLMPVPDSMSMEQVSACRVLWSS